MNERIRFLFCASLGGVAFESGMIGNGFGDLGAIGKVVPCGRKFYMSAFGAQLV